MKRWARKKAFTLLELMIVVIIIGILASLAIPRFIKATLSAKSAEAITNLGMLRSAEWRYYVGGDNKFTNVFSKLDIDDPNKVPNKKFSYTIPTSGDSLSIKAEYDVDKNKYITMDQDGNIVTTGF